MTRTREPKPKDWKWAAHDGVVLDYGSCLPCQRGEHNNCRHAQDGRQFTSMHPLGTCYCEHKNHDLPHWKGTCSAWVSGDWGGGHRCGKKAKGTLVQAQDFGNSLRDRKTVEIEVCGIHLAARRRREANDAKRAEERRVENEARDADGRAKAAAEDHAAILRGKGFKVAVVKDRETKLWMVGFQGETAVALVDRFEGAMREIGGAEAFAEEVSEITKGGRV